MLLLTPRWWAVAGLGDWDLVRVDQAGVAELLSQEVGAPGAGEATASLCQEGADLGGWFRSGVWPLEDQGLPFSLVLGTDGIRKSCASDADFLALTAWLAAGPEADAAGSDPAASDAGAGMVGGDDILAEALDRISAEGCGDDVSVAIGRWLAGEEGAPLRSDCPAPTAPTAPESRPPTVSVCFVCAPTVYACSCSSALWPCCAPLPWAGGSPSPRVWPVRRWGRGRGCRRPAARSCAARWGGFAATQPCCVPACSPATAKWWGCARAPSGRSPS